MSHRLDARRNRAAVELAGGESVHGTVIRDARCILSSYLVGVSSELS